MDLFTDVYVKSRNLLLASKCFEEELPNIQHELMSLFGWSGFNAGGARALDLVRVNLMQGGAFWSNTRRGATSGARGAAADAIFTIAHNIAARTPSLAVWKIAALLKMLKHTYWAKADGSHFVWVADNPTAYGKWVFDEFAGKSDSGMRELLSHEAEFYGATNRTLIAELYWQARLWIADIIARLYDPNTTVLASVQKIFINDGSTGFTGALQFVKGTLFPGFMKISKYCELNIIIFADMPPKRKTADRELAFGEVAGKKLAVETMPVIYIFRKGLAVDLDRRLTALAIIHELSHRAVQTDDFRYTDLKPQPLFPKERAQQNAQNWMWFVGDLLGVIPPALASTLQ